METRTISRELLLAKVSILGLEYFEDKLTGGLLHEPCGAHRAHAEQTKLEREMVLMRHFEEPSHSPWVLVQRCREIEVRGGHSRKARRCASGISICTRCTRSRHSLARVWWT